MIKDSGIPGVGRFFLFYMERTTYIVYYIYRWRTKTGKLRFHSQHWVGTTRTGPLTRQRQDNNYLLYRRAQTPPKSRDGIAKLWPITYQPPFSF